MSAWAGESGRSEIALNAPDLYPEGISAAPDGKLYISSLKRSEIIELDPDSGVQRVFAGQDADLMSVIGVRVSADGRRVYACSSDPAGQFGGRSTELVVFKRADGSVKGRYPLPGGGMCNDIALLESGEVLLTDSLNPRILSIKAGRPALAEWVRSDLFTGEGFGLNGIAAVGDQVYVVKYNTGEMFRIEGSTDARRVTPIALDRPLMAPDGLIALSATTFLVVEGGAGALTRVELDGDAGRTETVLSNLDVPTTAAMRGDEVFVVQGQLDHFFGMDPAAPEPFALVRAPLN